jgi:hypothetical protein
LAGAEAESAVAPRVMRPKIRTSIPMPQSPPDHWRCHRGARLDL